MKGAEEKKKSIFMRNSFFYLKKNATQFVAPFPHIFWFFLLFHATFFNHGNWSSRRPFCACCLGGASGPSPATVFCCFFLASLLPHKHYHLSYWYVYQIKKEGKKKGKAGKKKGEEKVQILSFALYTIQIHFLCI